MENLIEKQNLRILFLASDPSNESRLHLGKELQSVRDKLSANVHFEIKDHLATKPNDVMNEIMNYKPQIVHFSGHGSSEGELCFEDEYGKSKTIPPEALASLFNLVTDYVKCVIVNTCYAERQSKAIAQFIPIVIGTKSEISDDAAINFSSGFYTALNPDLSTESLKKAFNLGCIAIQFDGNLEEHLKPVIIYGSPGVRFASEVDSAFSLISNPKGNAVTTLINGLTLTGRKMGLTEAEAKKIIDDKIWKLQEYNNGIIEYEKNLKAILRDEFPLSDSSFTALSYLQSGLNLTNEDVKAINEKILSDPNLDNANSWYNRGLGQSQLQNYELAIEYYSKAIEKNNDYSAAFSERGLCHSKNENYELAIEDYSQAIEINNNWEISSNLSTTYFDRGFSYYQINPKIDENLNKAIEDWNQTLELNPNENSAHYNLGLAHEKLKDFDKAIKCFVKALEQGYSRKAVIYSGIIKCYSQLGETKKIQEWTKKAKNDLNLLDDLKEEYSGNNVES
ncbi:tetratricopeptide repeat protein [Aquimarina sp. MMG016]|uniref:tetratricopeptide repeat protein n=1 Tax=Aquimarina sp. MMG016 TaxID=2822690 RepID=UPI001B3A13AF|nr:tetratricopeptide repeat protein [Aquimarina sp. MMG016]MBQ4819450.1 tetratricopeptide repeat protein [Aquimarina sp. MMG016]